MKNKVYAIIVAYEPEEADLKVAIERLLKQTEIVIVCNNSIADFSYEHDSVRIFNFNDNLGIAEAQNVGMKWAFENGGNFVLQMDQDSVLEEKTVERLLESYEKLKKEGYNIGVIGPKHYDKDTKEVDEARIIKGKDIEGGYSIIKATISSCSLIPKKAYEMVGGVESGLFIDAVDFEYCWRLRKNGFLTFRDNNVLLGHKVGNGKKKILGKVDARIPSPIRHYYHIRNLFLLFWRAYVPVYWKISNLVKLVLKLVIYPFIFEDGIVRVKYMLKGMRDGLLGRYGRIDLASRKQR